MKESISIHFSQNFNYQCLIAYLMGKNRIFHWSSFSLSFITTEIKFGSLKKQESSRIISTSALLTTPKPLTVWTTTNCGKFWKRWDYQTTWAASWEICMQVRKQQLELEQQTGSKSGKEYVKAVYCHPAYLTYMQSTSWEMLGYEAQAGIKIAGKISMTSDMQMTPSYGRK